MYFLYLYYTLAFVQKKFLHLTDTYQKYEVKSIKRVLNIDIVTLDSQYSS